MSKKDAGLRRRELLGTGTGTLAEALCSSCCERARQLLHSKAAGELLVEVRVASHGMAVSALLAAEEAFQAHEQMSNVWL